jgi:hypothetical protein
MMESGKARSRLEPSIKKALYIIPMAYGELAGASLDRSGGHLYRAVASGGLVPG